MFSITKSFMSLAVGIAADKGFLSIDDLIATYFIEELPENPHPHVYQMTIRHLLTMSSGIHDDTFYDLFFKDDWIRAFLNQDFPHEPGTYYVYSSHASHMLSAIIQKVTGINLQGFLQKHLFSILDITDYIWENSPEGYSAGGMGLSLTVDALVKFARLLLNKGVYNNQRIVSEKYLELATTRQMTKQDNVNNPYARFIGDGYGFQFHIGPKAYRADGAFGQLVMIYPEKELAVIATSQYTNYDDFYRLIDQHFISNEADDSISKEQLENYLSSLTYCQSPNNQNKHQITDGTYLLSENELHIKKVQSLNNQVRFIYNNEKVDVFDISQPSYGQSHFLRDLKVHHQKHYLEPTWLNKETLLLKLLYIETPYVVTYQIKFFDTEIIFDFKVSVNFMFKGFTARGQYVK